MPTRITLALKSATSAQPSGTLDPNRRMPAAGEDGIGVVVDHDPIRSPEKDHGIERSVMLMVVRRLCGHRSIGPMEVAPQSKAFIRADASPPPARKSAGAVLRSPCTGTPSTLPVSGLRGRTIALGAMHVDGGAGSSVEPAERAALLIIAAEYSRRAICDNRRARRTFPALRPSIAKAELEPASVGTFLSASFRGISRSRRIQRLAEGEAVEMILDHFLHPVRVSSSATLSLICRWSGAAASSAFRSSEKGIVLCVASKVTANLCDQCLPLLQVASLHGRWEPSLR